ncbi:hypothetical protein D5S19_26335 [Amycolatopsis panacis]|uniref:Uncharacterized protein n=1 Tax=Amycolatopsis panacis TaxID=2340917 RepID=A0A419HSU3_9PSEU|nr:hypothetical protein D5S19_26335 [Amycolatopsis panacis]
MCIDPAAFRTVIDGVGRPHGVAAVVEYASIEERSARGVPTQCPYCDVRQRRQLGYEVRPSHPGLHPRTRQGRS